MMNSMAKLLETKKTSYKPDQSGETSCKENNALFIDWTFLMEILYTYSSRSYMKIEQFIYIYMYMIYIGQRISICI